MRRIAAVLAGGASRRMGEVKWLLPLHGEPAIARIARAFAGFGEETVAVLPWDADEALRERANAVVNGRAAIRWLTDAAPNGGPLAGLEAAFVDANECGGPALCAVIAADMPFASRGLAEALAEACVRESAEAAAPVWDGRLQPLFAVYRTDTLDRLRAYRANSGAKVSDWLRTLRLVELPEEETARYDPDGRALFNMNTPEEYERARRWIIGQDT